MITRRHFDGATASRALYSDCERYRYLLERIWGQPSHMLFYIMLNPSKATEEKNDPTIERCERRARQLGYGGFAVGNLFAWRETHPEKLKKARKPVGPDNDTVLVDAAAKAKTVLCAWGVHGVHQSRAHHVAHLLQARGIPLFSLGQTKLGHPRHPLYVPYTQQPETWQTTD